MYMGYVDGGLIKVAKITCTGNTSVTFDAVSHTSIAHGLTSNNALRLIATRGETGTSFILIGENGTGNQFATQAGTIDTNTGALTLGSLIPFTVGAGRASGNTSNNNYITSASINGNSPLGMMTFTNGTTPTIIGFKEDVIGSVNLNPVGLAKNAIASLATGDVSLNSDIITGLTGLTIGSKYYMNTTTGALQTGVTSVPVGFALSTTELQVRINA
jgi:hypothetical protein